MLAMQRQWSATWIRDKSIINTPTSLTMKVKSMINYDQHKSLLLLLALLRVCLGRWLVGCLLARGKQHLALELRFGEDLADWDRLAVEGSHWLLFFGLLEAHGGDGLVEEL